MTSIHAAASPLQPNIQIYSWTPSHNQIWLPDVKRQIVKQYANWNKRHVTVYQPTDCTPNTLGSWWIPSVNIRGQFTVTGTFTRIPIDLPPYIDDFRLFIECEDTTIFEDWLRHTSIPIPTLYWRHTRDGNIETILHNGQSLSLHISVQQQHEDDFQELIVLSASHPLETWTLPALSVQQIELRLMDGTSTLFEETIIPPHSRLEPGTIFSSNSIPRLDLVESAITRLQTPIDDVDAVDFRTNYLEYIPNNQGVYWLEHQTLSNTSIEAFWVYDGIWKWFAAPVWKTSNVNQLVTVPEPLHESSHIPFLRWNDILLIENRSWVEGVIETNSKWTSGDPYQQTDIPLLISPEDQLIVEFDTLSLMSSHITTDISTIESTSTVDRSRKLFRTDVQASDDRLTSLLPFIFTPLTPQTAARLLHSAALFWNPLHLRDLPWFDQILQMTNQALRLLEELSETDWSSLDNQTRVFVVWASLTADKEGLSPSSSLMRRNLDWLCTIDNVNAGETAVLIAHVRWMLTQSHWKHRSCNKGNTTQITANSLTKPHIKTIKTALNEAWEKKTIPKLPPESSEWMHWILLEQEQQMKERYVNLNLILQSESDSDRGLFHEWQVRPLNKTLLNSDTWTLSVKGVGRLYTSLWLPSSTLFSDSSDVHLHVQRKFLTVDGQHLNTLECEQGQTVQIQTHVQTTPNTPFCIREWSASGLSNNQTSESHFCTISDDLGQWNQTTHASVLFDGRFRLPTTMVATETEVAHSQTVWFETRQYKELMPE